MILHIKIYSYILIMVILLLSYDKDYRKNIGGKWYKVSYYGIIYYTNKKPYFANNFSRIIEKERY